MADLQTPADFLRRAVVLAGGQSAMGRLLDVSQTTVWRWVDRGGSLPAEHVLKVEDASGISRHDLRPDIYPREQPSSTGSVPIASLPSSGRDDTGGGGASIHNHCLISPRDGKGTCDRSALLQAGEAAR